MLQLTLEKVNSPEQETFQNGAASSMQYADLYALKDCYFYLSDLFDVASAAKFDEAVFQVYLELGKPIIAALKLQTSTSSQADAVQRGLKSFNSFWQLSSGQSMERIWSCCRPATPATLPHLERILQAEQLAERLDNLLWTSVAPLRKMTELRQSVREMVAVTAGAEIEANDLEVDRYPNVPWPCAYVE